MISSEVAFTPGFLSNGEVYLESILHKEHSIQWTQTATNKDGEPCKLPRSMAYVSDNAEMYNYAGLTIPGSFWTVSLTALRILVEDKTNHKFNSCLLNYYPNGKSKINWHSDKEPQLGENPVIACINLGGTRKFHFLNKETGEKSFYEVKDGDLLVMLDNCQKTYLHAILPERGIIKPRLSLTFRWVYPVGQAKNAIQS